MSALAITIPSFWFRFYIVTCISIAAIAADDSSISSYKDHCSSVVPQSTPTNPTSKDSLPSFTTSYFTGGDQIFNYGRRNNYTFYYAGKYVRLRIRPNCHETNEKGVYKIGALLYFRSPYAFDYDDARGNYSYGGSYYRRRSRGFIRFSLTGFWSENSRKACMVGSTKVYVGEGKILSFSGVFKLKYPAENPTIRNGVVSGILETTSSKSDAGYFDPISMFSFPDFPHYKYSLLSKDIGSLGGLQPSNGQSLKLQPGQFCNLVLWKPIFFNMEYAAECTDPHSCSQLGNSSVAMPGFLHLTPIHCLNEERKTRYIAKLQNYSIDESFSFESTLVAEGFWDDKNGEMIVGACRILNPIDHFEDAVGDCGIRLRLRYPSAWTIKDDLRIIGQLWGDAKGSFRKINLTSEDMNDVVGILGLKYEYTEMERVQKSCPMKKPAKKGKKTYPDGKSYDMRFDASVLDSKGKLLAFSFVTPLFVGNESYQGNGVAVAVDAFGPTSDVGFATISESDEISARVSVLNISYRININPYSDLNSSVLFPVLNMSQDPNHFHQVEITAEGSYNVETGQLCMVGCRKLYNSSIVSTDCEILVKFDFAPLNMRKGDRIKGTIKSKRLKGDALHFEDLTMTAAAYYTEVAEESVWRMDLEITLVLISNTLFCIFVGLQIFHGKRNPEVVSSISLIMVMILALGHMIPLILNIEAVFLDNHRKQTVFLSSGGWLEANEVAVRVIMMVAFLLQIRLLQLVWTAKQSGDNNKSPWNGERKASFIMLPLYILGALLALLLNWMRNRYGYQNYSLWGDLRSYAGLILDGFLLPQMVLNAVRGSTEKALSHPFYIGTSAVRLVPHAYNQYRAHSYPEPFVNGTYYYANPAADFYSTAWDVVIPLGVMAMAAAVFLQQRRGGRCILPQRFRELELYAKVPTADNE